MKYVLRMVILAFAFVLANVLVGCATSGIDSSTERPVNTYASRSTSCTLDGTILVTKGDLYLKNPYSEKEYFIQQGTQFVVPLSEMGTSFSGEAWGDCTLTFEEEAVFFSYKFTGFTFGDVKDGKIPVNPLS